MNVKERIAQNKQKLTGILQRINQIDTERQELIQEALRLDGRIMELTEQQKEVEEQTNGSKKEKDD